jgi:hypothetical protein
MLKVERCFIIKTLCQCSLSISEIAELTGHSRRTIRKVVNGPVSPLPQKRKLRQSKLDRSCRTLSNALKL